MNSSLSVWQFLEAVEGLRLAALARLLVRAAHKSYLPYLRRNVRRVGAAGNRTAPSHPRREREGGLR